MPGGGEMTILEDEFGDIVRKARAGNGLSVGQLAHVVGISASDIESIESYKLRPSPDIAELLAKALGLDPNKLIDSLIEEWSPAAAALPSNGMIVEQIVVKYGNYNENAYILGCSETKIGAVIDPGGAAEEISARLDALGLKLDAVIITHAHADHTGGIKALIADWHDVRIVSHQLERDSIMHGLSNRWEAAKDGVIFTLGKLEVVPISTPGHTPGSVCYRVGGVCFVGDTLFAGSIGRPASIQAYRSMLEFIRCRVLSLPSETAILPGHGPVTTVAQEQAHNPFF